MEYPNAGTVPSLFFEIIGLNSVLLFAIVLGVLCYIKQT